MAVNGWMGASCFLFSAGKEGEHMPEVTTRQIERVKEWKLFSYLQQHELEVLRCAAVRFFRKWLTNINRVV